MVDVIASEEARNLSAGFRFPEDLDLATDGHIEFQIKPSRGNADPVLGSIRLHIPNGIQKTDGITYTNTDLKAVQSIIRGVKELDESIAGQLVEVSQKNLTKRLVSQVAGNVIQALLGSDIVDDQAVAGAIDFNRETAIQTNTKALLERINIRTFTLQFTFIPQSPQESATINSVVRAFRENMYPEVDENIYYLRYPNLFGISIFPAGGATENEYITRYLDSYLTSCAVTHNTTATTYFDNGAPMETTMTLTFTEFQTPTKDDIRGGF